MVPLGAGLCAGTALPLGIVAAGTGNDVATALGLPVHDAPAAARVIAGGSVRSIDAGRVVDADGITRWWVGVLGAGFDSLVNERANRWVRPRGRLRYTLAVARELPVFRPVPFVLELDGDRRQARAMLVAVGNGPSYGEGCASARTPTRPTDCWTWPWSTRCRPRRSCGCSPGSSRAPTCGTPPSRWSGHGGSGWRRRASSRSPTASGSARCPWTARWCRARCASSAPPDVA